MRVLVASQQGWFESAQVSHRDKEQLLRIVSSLVADVHDKFIADGVDGENGRGQLHAQVQQHLGALLKKPHGLTVHTFGNLVAKATPEAVAKSRDMSTRVHCNACGRGYLWSQVFADDARSGVIKETCTYLLAQEQPCGASLVKKVHTPLLQGGIRYDPILTAPFTYVLFYTCVHVIYEYKFLACLRLTL